VSIIIYRNNVETPHWLRGPLVLSHGVAKSLEKALEEHGVTIAQCLVVWKTLCFQRAEECLHRRIFIAVSCRTHTLLSADNTQGLRTAWLLYWLPLSE
jgi:hypothetical protein